MFVDRRAFWFLWICQDLPSCLLQWPLLMLIPKRAPVPEFHPTSQLFQCLQAARFGISLQTSGCVHTEAFPMNFQWDPTRWRCNSCHRIQQRWVHTTEAQRPGSRFKWQSARSLCDLLEARRRKVSSTLTKFLPLKKYSGISCSREELEPIWLLSMRWWKTWERRRLCGGAVSSHSTVTSMFHACWHR